MTELPVAATPSRHGPPPRGAWRARRIGPFLLRPLWRIKLHGAENVPAAGPVILAGNHTGFLDGPLIVGLSPRPVHFMVKQEMFRGAVGSALRWLGQISVDRAGADRAAVLAALGALQDGGVLGVFPEGTRSAGDFATMHNGLAYFALRSGAPVVPVACLGSAERGSSAKALPALRSRIDLVFGPPVELGRGAGRTAVDAASARLRDVLRAHLDEARIQTGRVSPARGDVNGPDTPETDLASGVGGVGGH
jgi:1-acyl-sn-glycerol-3-phosphate acyltransferase